MQANERAAQWYRGALNTLLALFPGGQHLSGVASSHVRVAGRVHVLATHRAAPRTEPRRILSPAVHDRMGQCGAGVPLRDV